MPVSKFWWKKNP